MERIAQIINESVRRTGWRDWCIAALSVPAFSMPNRKIMGVLNDIGTEELAHLEIVSTIVHQLTRGLSVEEIENPVWHRIMWIIP